MILKQFLEWNYRREDIHYFIGWRRVESFLWEVPIKNDKTIST